MIKIFSDPACNFTQAECQRYQVSILPYLVSYQGTEYLTQSWYDAFKQTYQLTSLIGQIPPVFSRPPLNSWKELLEPYLQAGNDILYRDFIDNDVFIKNSFCLLLDSPYPFVGVRSKLPQHILSYSGNGWELSCYYPDNPQTCIKDKMVPPNNIFGIICSKSLPVSDMSDILTDAVTATFPDSDFIKNEYNELYLDNAKVLGLDTFQRTNDYGDICSFVIFFLFVSDISDYKNDLDNMSRKSRYGSIYPYVLNEDRVKSIKDSLAMNLVSRGMQ